ncbi:CASP8 and FADD-like apoptosis regulator isoform X2 [Amia ocellicauda]|uniref:CASP8 and FADD-like apoptosis regulator isoform X2 n=1 Tax=Amia ocellicauda TaxID=2972642 RepID=UPI003464010C
MSAAQHHSRQHRTSHFEARSMRKELCHFAMADLQLSLTINHIAEELNSDECKMLLYLCSDMESSIEDVKDMLKSLMKRGEVDQIFLLELMYRIKRFDLLKKVFRSTKKEVEGILGHKCVVSEYRVLMADVSEDLDNDDLHALIFLLSDSLPRGRLDKAKSFIDIIIELEKQDKVSHEKVDLIEQCLRSIRRVDLAKRVHMYQRKGIKPTISIQNQKEKMQHRPACPPPQLPEASSTPSLTQRMWQQPSAALAPENIKIAVPETGMQYCQNTEDVYRMQTIPRGICLIIDCIGFDGDMLQQTFQRLQFKVILYKWLNLADALSILNETSRMTEFQYIDCFVCCIISRGTSNAMLATECEGPGLKYDAIKHLFTADHCPGLLGKPKLFFIQNYCRNADVEADAPSRACSMESIPHEADIFWSYCKTEAAHLEKTQHQSIYCNTLSAGLMKGQRRKMCLTDVHTDVNGIMYEHNRKNPKQVYYMVSSA